jgi:hypothetical protein
MAANFPRFDHDVIYVWLYGSAYEVSKNLEYTLLVCSPRVLRPSGMVT